MAKKSKGNRILITLECTEQRKMDVAGISRYVTEKNRKNTPEKFEFKKYDPVVRKHVVFKEAKIK